MSSFTRMVFRLSSTDYLISKINPALSLASLCHSYKHLLELPAFKEPLCSQNQQLALNSRLLSFPNHLTSVLGIISISQATRLHEKETFNKLEPEVIFPPEKLPLSASLCL